MSNIFFEILLRFGRDMGVEAKMQGFIGIIAAAMLLFALASCFFGFKVFRVWCSILAFMLTAIAIHQLLKNVVGMRVIIVTFAIIGLLVAVLAYHWFRAGAFVLVTILVYGLMQNLSDKPWLCILIALFLAGFTIPYYGHIVIFATSIWGASTLVTDGVRQYSLAATMPMQIIIIVVLGALGIFVQYKTNRRETLYAGNRFTAEIKRVLRPGRRVKKAGKLTKDAPR